MSGNYAGDPRIPNWAGDPRVAQTVTAGVMVPVAQHTYTPACDGFHAPGPCPVLSPPVQVAVSEPFRAALLVARDALRHIALGTVRDPSVTADMALVAIRGQLGELLPADWDDRAEASQ